MIKIKLKILISTRVYIVYSFNLIYKLKGIFLFRHVFQLTIVLSLLRKEFPDVPELETKENLKDSAEILLEEMRLYLANASQAQIQRAQINTDYFIP